MCVSGAISAHIGQAMLVYEWPVHDPTIQNLWCSNFDNKFSVVVQTEAQQEGTPTWFFGGLSEA